MAVFIVGAFMMANKLAAKPRKALRRGHLLSDILSRGPMQGSGRVPVVLGAALIGAGFVGRKKGSLAHALGAFAGIAMVTSACVVPRRPGRAGGRDGIRNGDAEPELEVRRAITIGRTADELRQLWLAPRTIQQLMAGCATLHAAGESRMRWEVRTPLGRVYQWESEIVSGPDGGVGWRSLPDIAIPNEGAVRFEPAPNDRGTVVTLHVRFGAPGGALGEKLLELLGRTPLNLIADRALRRFKSLAETGEIPTTGQQPAAR
ncbi:hypothetical protein [Burkholderia gladioli]|uniref:SRPBCC family protein n=1 Tax=Burkholderia gladioli TaxID=28095 RepID=UPI001641E77A|nr:hypothetical protein [Burkholderia gladioli]